jgi:hypothetical protein
VFRRRICVQLVLVSMGYAGPILDIGLFGVAGNVGLFAHAECTGVALSIALACRPLLAGLAFRVAIKRSQPAHSYPGFSKTFT